MKQNIKMIYALGKYRGTLASMKTQATELRRICFSSDTGSITFVMIEETLYNVGTKFIG
jgi:hypothetical protein